MTERQLQEAVTGMCKLLGVACYHTYDSRRSAAGWPDLALCGKHGFMTRELKSATGKPTKAQQEWGAMLRHAGIGWDIWRPADLRSGRIQRELQEIR